MSPGTTSACAENTKERTAIRQCPWNYLRVRGEYCPTCCALSALTELPPRARRILNILLEHGHCSGTTSACAENTICGAGVAWHLGNYLRVRGEYTSGTDRIHFSTELPPRARRILTDFLKNAWEGGTTSACAENTPIPGICMGAKRNYLRVRGEYPANSLKVLVTLELPPRARRIRGYAIPDQAV